MLCIKLTWQPKEPCSPSTSVLSAQAIPRKDLSKRCPFRSEELLCDGAVPDVRWIDVPPPVRRLVPPMVQVWWLLTVAPKVAPSIEQPAHAVVLWWIQERSRWALRFLRRLQWRILRPGSGREYLGGDLQLGVMLLHGNLSIILKEFQIVSNLFNITCLSKIPHIMYVKQHLRKFCTCTPCRPHVSHKAVRLCRRGTNTTA